MIINKGISIQIMGKEYQVACPPDKITELHAAALLLSEKMQEIKNTGKIIGNEKIAVMAAINLANELLTLKGQSVWQDSDIQDKLTMLCNKVEKVLETA